MKKWISICLIIAGMVVKAQTLEHTYSGTISVFNVSSTESVFAAWEQKTRTLSIYDKSHNLLKSIVANISDTAAGLGNVSRTLFDTDSDFEFFVTSQNGAYVIDGDGLVKFSKLRGSKAAFGSYVASTKQGGKLMIYSYDIINSSLANYTYEVYGLAGNLVLGKKEELADEGLFKAFPNPSNDFVIIPVKSNSDNVAVYNMEGKLIAELKDKNSQLDIRIYPAGIYNYSINGKYAGKFVKE